MSVLRKKEEQVGAERTANEGARADRRHSSNWGGIQRQSHGIGIGIGIGGIGIDSKNSIGNLGIGCSPWP